MSPHLWHIRVTFLGSRQPMTVDIEAEVGTKAVEQVLEGLEMKQVPLSEIKEIFVR